MNSLSLAQLRDWQRNYDFDRVISWLHANKERPCPPREKAVIAVSLALSGARQGRALLKEVADQEPEDGDTLWLSDVGLACLLIGAKEKSFRLLKKAAARPDATAFEYGRLAAVYLVREDLEKAGELYQEAIHRAPGHGIWHHNLGSILVRQQRLEAALENFETALKLAPDQEKTHHSRMMVLRALDQTAIVVEELESQLKKDSTDLLLRLRLARALDQDNRITDAVNLLKEALLPVEDLQPGKGHGATDEATEKTKSEQITLRMEMARIFNQRSRHGLALRALRQVESLDPEDPVHCLVQQASALSEMRQFDSAMEKLDAAEEAVQKRDSTGQSDNFEVPRHLPIDIVRASVLAERGDYDQAESTLRQLLEIYPGHAGLLSQLGQCLLWTGALEEAGDCFEKAANINPLALAAMVNAKRLPDDPNALKKMCKLADNPLVAEPARINMSYALASLYDKRNESDTAWSYLTTANRLSDRQINYDPDRFSRNVDLHRQIFTRSFFDRQPAIRHSDRTPIFVVGMPRSGTTLTEQILCSHPDIFGAGELDLMGRMIRLMPRVVHAKRPYPHCLNKFTLHFREHAARNYLYGLYNYDRRHSFVVDKMPHNFMNLGLIALIFPTAKLIHVQRDPRDTALSNYQQNFKAKHGGLGYAFNLEKIARQINDYHRMMAHWRQVLPIPMFEFFYEDLVADQDRWSRRLLEFVGVGWDDSVHDFHKTERAVRTASVSQVRQPIYKTSQQKWRRYEKNLSQLLDNLDPKIMI